MSASKIEKIFNIHSTKLAKLLNINTTQIVKVLNLDFIIEVPAVEPEGEGTEFDPYIIEILGHLKYASEHPELWGGHFLQIANIDADNTRYWNDRKGFKPIGRFDDSYNNIFIGSYNGQNYKISNLYINGDNNLYKEAAMFLNVEYTDKDHPGRLQNINLVDINYEKTIGNAAGLIIWSWGAEVINCHVTGRIEQKGITNGPETAGLITWCFGNVYYGDNTIPTKITNCSAKCILIGQNYIGGLVGWVFFANIINSYADCEIHGYGYLGGFSMWSIDVDDESVYIKDCYSRGKIYSSGYDNDGNNGSFSGGFMSALNIGYFIGIVESYIKNCYSAVEIINTSGVPEMEHIGGFIAGGNGDGGDVIDCFWDSDIAPSDDSYGGIPKTTTEMKQQVTFTNWDFDYIWGITPAINDGYPNLRVIKTYEIENEILDTESSGGINNLKYYEIESEKIDTESSGGIGELEYYEVESEKIDTESEGSVALVVA